MFLKTIVTTLLILLTNFTQINYRENNAKIIMVGESHHLIQNFLIDKKIINHLIETDKRKIVVLFEYGEDWEYFMKKYIDKGDTTGITTFFKYNEVKINRKIPDSRKYLLSLLDFIKNLKQTHKNRIDIATVDRIYTYRRLIFTIRTILQPLEQDEKIHQIYQTALKLEKSGNYGDYEKNTYEKDIRQELLSIKEYLKHKLNDFDYRYLYKMISYPVKKEMFSKKREHYIYKNIKQLYKKFGDNTLFVSLMGYRHVNKWYNKKHSWFSAGYLLDKSIGSPFRHKVLSIVIVPKKIKFKNNTVLNFENKYPVKKEERELLNRYFNGKRDGLVLKLDTTSLKYAKKMFDYFILLPEANL